MKPRLFFHITILGFKNKNILGYFHITNVSKIIIHRDDFLTIVMLFHKYNLLFLLILYL